MRTAGGQQLSQLSTEAAWALKHSLSLARRRGHSQVTPLHVAATLIGSTLLKAACFKTQNPNPNPLQCRALELCFNVALNRLPTTPTPLQPSLSNALVAALKRAQAHQRRGSCVEQQQAPLLAVKVEVEQLILSILDDPSVSRVMREAGFSSTEVKNNIEENFSSLSSSSVFNSSNGGVYSTPPSPPDHRVPNNGFNFWQNPFWKQKMGRQACFGNRNSEDDIKLILEVLLKKKRKSNIVIVGDSVSSTEGLVIEIMDRIEKGDSIVPEELKTTHFIKFQFSSMPLRYMKREEVEMNMLELKRKVDCFLAGGKRVIVYTGDLNWTLGDDRESGFLYNPVEHLVCDIGKLISEYNSGDFINSNNGRVWLMGTANYQTYMKCQMKQPSLENQWCLQAVSVPSGGLALSLHATSVQDSRIALSQKTSQMVVDTKPFCAKEENDKLTCCDECTSKYEKEAATLTNKDLDKTSTQLPFWLQPQITDMQKDDLVELRSKWNRLCHIQQHRSNPIHNNANSPMAINRNLSNDRTCAFPSSNSSWSSPNNLLESNSISFIHSNSKPIYTSSYPRFRRQQSCHIDFSSNDGDQKKQVSEPNLDSLKNTEGKDVKITLALGSSLLPDDGKLVEKQHEVLEKLKENVPWQVETVPLIVAALVQESKLGKNESWLLIEGNDFVGKRRLALGLAESVFGSTDFLLHLNMKEREHKRDLFCETLGSALRDSENLVVLVENVNFADTQFLKFLSDAFEGGKSGAMRRKTVKSGQIIFILTKNDSASPGDGTDLSSIIQMKLEVREISSNSGNKRKAEWDLPSKAKNPRTAEKQNTSSPESAEPKRLTSRQSSSNTLDLNLKAEDEENEYESEISKTSTKFLEMIKDRYIFNRDSTQNGMTKDMILYKITKSFEEVCKREGHFGSVFGVDDKLLEEFSICAGYFLDSQFEKWLKQVFETSLKKVNIGVTGGETSVWLCLDTKEVTGTESSGYMGSCLPKKIQVSFMG